MDFEKVEEIASKIGRGLIVKGQLECERSTRGLRKWKRLLGRDWKRIERLEEQEILFYIEE